MDSSLPNDIKSVGEQVLYYHCQYISMGTVISSMYANQWYPGNKVHGANMGPTWVLSAQDEPHIVPKNLAIRAPLIHISIPWYISHISVWYVQHMIRYGAHFWVKSSFQFARVKFVLLDLKTYNGYLKQCIRFAKREHYVHEFTKYKNNIRKHGTPWKT